MSINTIVTIVTIVIGLAVATVIAITYFKNRSLEEIRADVYQLFLKAEHNPEVMESGKQKMKWVLTQVRNILPGWVKLIVSDECLEKIVEGWFRAVKDLLDDGKYNKSIE